MGFRTPEQELEDFLVPLPQWLQNALWCVALTDLENFSWYDSYFPFTADQLEELKTTAAGWQPERYPRTAEELRPRFEQILQRCGPAQWKRYCDNAKASGPLCADAAREAGETQKGCPGARGT